MRPLYRNLNSHHMSELAESESINRLIHRGRNASILRTAVHGRCVVRGRLFVTMSIPSQGLATGVGPSHSVGRQSDPPHRPPRRRERPSKLHFPRLSDGFVK